MTTPWCELWLDGGCGSPYLVARSLFPEAGDAPLPVTSGAAAFNLSPVGRPPCLVVSLTDPPREAHLGPGRGSLREGTENLKMEKHVFESHVPIALLTSRCPVLFPFPTGASRGVGWGGSGGLFQTWPNGPSHQTSSHHREEKTEQLVDTRHEVDQLVLELQKVKQEVSRMECACVSVHMCVLHLCPGGGGAGTPQ